MVMDIYMKELKQLKYYFIRAKVIMSIFNLLCRSKCGTNWRRKKRDGNRNYNIPPDPTHREGKGITLLE